MLQIYDLITKREGFSVSSARVSVKARRAPRDSGPGRRSHAGSTTGPLPGFPLTAKASSRHRNTLYGESSGFPAAFAAALLAFPGASRGKTPTVSILCLTQSQAKIENIRDFTPAVPTWVSIGKGFSLQPAEAFFISPPSSKTQSAASLCPPLQCKACKSASGLHRVACSSSAACCGCTRESGIGPRLGA